MTDSPRFSDAPQRLEELTAVLAQMGAVVLPGDHRYDDRVGYHLGRRNHSATTGAGVTLVDAHGKQSMAALGPTG
jgi:hypothetical protein